MPLLLYAYFSGKKYGRISNILFTARQSRKPVGHIRVFITHWFRPKLQRLPHVGTVELGALGWIGAGRVVIRPAIEDIAAVHYPGRQISRRLDVHRQAGRTGDSKTKLTAALAGGL